ncbi:MAG: hypothetical protein OFPII_24910 [Osedax symbiont Rs1]|nr:MAG: hypothetical protein OFPII_24910 [Osedax symbiont Rs1]
MTPETNRHLRQCYVGIGSNLDNPLQHVNIAINQLKQLKDTTWVGVSSLYRSAPVGPAGQDDYINAVASFHTNLEPEILLDKLQQLEDAHQRVRIEHWGARTLDLDILLIDNICINTSRLTVPHPYLHLRNFVLIPLIELAGDILINDTKISKLITNCPSGSLDKL